MTVNPHRKITNCISKFIQEGIEVRIIIARRIMEIILHVGIRTTAVMEIDTIVESEKLKLFSNLKFKRQSLILQDFVFHKFRWTNDKRLFAFKVATLWLSLGYNHNSRRDYRGNSGSQLWRPQHHYCRQESHHSGSYSSETFIQNCSNLLPTHQHVMCTMNTEIAARTRLNIHLCEVCHRT